MSYYRQQLENWISNIEVKAHTVFDVGGMAKPVNTRVKTWEVDNYIILDNEAEGDLTGLPAINFLEIDMNKSLTKNGYDSRSQYKADVIFCLEVFEYIYDPVQAASNLFQFMRGRDSIAYVSFPFVYPLHNPWQIDYLRYTLSGVRKILNKAGFSKLKIDTRIDGSGKLQEFYRADGMHPAKGFDNSITGFMVEARL